MPQEKGAEMMAATPTEGISASDLCLSPGRGLSSDLAG